MKQTLYRCRDPYDIDASSQLFMKEVRKNLKFHREHNPTYARILKDGNIALKDIRTEADIAGIPVIPTLYFKNNRLFTLADQELLIKAKSSGTMGMQSQVGFDRGTLRQGMEMLYRFFSYHGLLSPVPCNYIILGEKPHPSNQKGVTKTIRGAAWLTPALSKVYALKMGSSGYEWNGDGILKALALYERMGLPVRILGFPAYLAVLLKELSRSGKRFRLAPGSRLLYGGGFKELEAYRIEETALLKLVAEHLHIPSSSCYEFFSAVEHPVPYCKCSHRHFHVPVYSRAVIRDVKTLEPLPYGEMGLLSFVTPLVYSMPLLSVVTDDLAVLYPGSACGCEISAPYFELCKRAKAPGIQTCAAQAIDVMGGLL